MNMKDELVAEILALPLEERVEFVEANIQSAFEWYESQRPGLGEQYLGALREKLEFVREHPQASPVKRRIAEIDSGTAKLIPAEEVFAEVRRLLK